jgi:hypothetical protein
VCHSRPPHEKNNPRETQTHHSSVCGVILLRQPPSSPTGLLPARARQAGAMGSCFSSEGGGSRRKARTATSRIPRAEQSESIVPTELVIPGLVHAAWSSCSVSLLRSCSYSRKCCSSPRAFLWFSALLRFRGLLVR